MRDAHARRTPNKVPRTVPTSVPAALDNPRCNRERAQVGRDTVEYQNSGRGRPAAIIDQHRLRRIFHDHSGIGEQLIDERGRIRHAHTKRATLSEVHPQLWRR